MTVHVETNLVRYEVGKNCDVRDCRIYLGGTNDGRGRRTCLGVTCTISGNTQTARFGPLHAVTHTPVELWSTAR